MAVEQFTKIVSAIHLSLNVGLIFNSNFFLLNLKFLQVLKCALIVAISVIDVN